MEREKKKMSVDCTDPFSKFKLSFSEEEESNFVHVGLKWRTDRFGGRKGGTCCLFVVSLELGGSFAVCFVFTVNAFVLYLCSVLLPNA